MTHADRVARVSSTGQSLDSQIEALEAAGCQKVYSDKVSGRSATDRLQLALALNQIREGDTLVVTRLDRLARSVSDLHRIMERLQAEKVASVACSRAVWILPPAPAS